MVTTMAEGSDSISVNVGVLSSALTVAIQQAASMDSGQMSMGICTCGHL